MSDPRPDDAQLGGWLDRELDGDQHAQVEAWLRAHPDEAARVRLWGADRDALRARLDAVLDEPVPAAMREFVLEGGRAPAPGWRDWRIAAAAAGLLLCGGLVGALVGRQWPAAAPGGPIAESAQLAPPAQEPGWARAAAVAHAVYVPELRHPVEVSVAGDAATQKAQEEHLMRWLTKRLSAPVTLFNLRNQGFELVGGRLLPDTSAGGSGPSAQLMYQDRSGTRVTVYLRRPENNGETAVRYERDGELGLFYWVDGGFGYALVGALPRERLLALCEEIYAQVEAAASQPAR